jgi:hypothetical protein
LTDGNEAKGKASSKREVREIPAERAKNGKGILPNFRRKMRISLQLGERGRPTGNCIKTWNNNREYEFLGETKCPFI